MGPGGAGAGKIEVLVARCAAVIVLEDKITASDVDVAQLKAGAQQINFGGDPDPVGGDGVDFAAVVVFDD
mgnify:FL=1